MKSCSSSLVKEKNHMYDSCNIDDGFVKPRVKYKYKTAQKVCIHLHFSVGVLQCIRTQVSGACAIDNLLHVLTCSPKCLCTKTYISQIWSLPSKHVFTVSLIGVCIF